MGKMQVSRFAAPVLGVIVAVGLCMRLKADSIVLSTAGGNQSVVTATVDNGDFTFPSNSNDVNSLPFTTPTSESVGNTSSEVDSNLTSSGFNFSFTQSSSDPNYSMDGNGAVYFTAAAGTQYSISGSLEAFGSDYLTDIYCTLTDVTQGTTLFYYSNSNFYFPEEAAIAEAPTTTFTIDNSQGYSLTGQLVGTDQYEFYADENLSNEDDPNLSGNIAIGFASATIPLPRPIGGGWC
jgi:hypothetical protein